MGRRFAADVGSMSLAAILGLNGCAGLLAGGRHDPGAGADVAPGTAFENLAADSSAIARTLVPVWTRGIGRGVSAGVARSDSVVVLGTADRRLLALRLADGERTWIRGTRGPYSAALTSAGPRVYAVSDGREGMLRSVSADAGGFAWTRATGAATAAPVVAGDVVIVATLEGLAIAIDRKSGDERWKIHLPGPVRATPVVIDSAVAIAAAGGEVVLLRASDGDEISHFMTSRGVEADLMTAGGQLIVPSHSFGVEVHALPGGERIWGHFLPAGCCAAAIEGDHVVTLSPDGLVDAVRLTDGGSEWTVRLPGEYDGSFSVGARAILAGGVDGYLRVISRDGRFLTEWKAGESLLAPPILWRDRVFVVGSQGHAWLLAASGDSIRAPLAVRVGFPNPFLGGGRGITDTGETMLYTAPFDAEVAHGDSILGTTPIALSPFTGGESFRLRFPGFASLDVPSDSLFASPPPHRFVLTPVAPESSSRDEGPHWTRRAVIALGVALASGGAAILAKDRADDNFDRYRRTGDPDLRKEYFDSAETWDRISVAAWGLNQVATAFTIYFFVRRDEASSRPAPIDEGWSSP